MPIASVVSGKGKKNSENEPQNNGQKRKMWGKCRKQLTDYEKYIRQQDWYYQHSWFEKEYFIHKLKRKLMNFIYKLFEKSLETYFIEIEFYSGKSNKLDEYNRKHGTEYSGDFQMYLPILVQVKHISQAVVVMNRIVKTLKDEYKVEDFLLTRIDKNPMSKKRFEQTLDTLNKTYEWCDKTKLEISTYKPHTISNTEQEPPKITNIDIKVISVGSVSWTKQFDYTVMIHKTINEE